MKGIMIQRSFFLNCPFFEAPQALDFCDALTPSSGFMQGSVTQSAVIRVLLREALSGGVARLEVEQISSGEEAWMGISIDFNGRDIRSLCWSLVHGHNDWTSECRWPWGSLENVVEPWSEFVAQQVDARDLLIDNIEESWKLSVGNSGIDAPPALLGMNFSDNTDPIVRRYLDVMCTALLEYDVDVLWGVFLDEEFLESVDEQVPLDAVRTALSELVQQLGVGSMDKLLELSEVWGSDTEVDGVARWAYSCCKPFPDAMVWDQLPWEQQKFVLESCDPWVVGLACSLPDTDSEIIEWAATFEDEFVAHVIANRLNGS
jgi:hypothetical protein